MKTIYQEERRTKTGREYQWVVRVLTACALCGQEHGREEALGWGNPKPHKKQTAAVAELLFKQIHLHIGRIGKRTVCRDCLEQCAKELRRARKIERAQKHSLQEG